MLTLQPPVPTGDFEFETTFREPDVDTRTRLSAARSRMTRAMLPLVTTEGEGDVTADVVQEAIQAATGYRERWLPFWRNHVSMPGTCTTRVPVEFRWRVALFAAAPGEGSCEYADPSPLVETACVTLAVAAAHQRMANARSARAAAELARAAELIEWVRTDVLPRFRPRIGGARREPYVMSDGVLEAVHHAIGGQAACKAAMLQAVRAPPPPTRTAVELFRGARRFQQAVDVLPATIALRRGGNRASAGAYRYLALALIEENAEYGGVAVACAAEAVRLAGGGRHGDFLSDMQRRNDGECGMQTVPLRTHLSLHFAADATRLRIEHIASADDVKNVRIVIPLV